MATIPTTQCEVCKTEHEDAKHYITPDSVIHYLCDDHAIDIGFCPACGWLVAGNEWDDIHIDSYGMCSGCFRELQDEQDDEDDYDYYEY